MKENFRLASMIVRMRWLEQAIREAGNVVMEFVQCTCAETEPQAGLQAIRILACGYDKDGRTGVGRASGKKGCSIGLVYLRMRP